MGASIGVWCRTFLQEVSLDPERFEIKSEQGCRWADSCKKNESKSSGTILPIDRHGPYKCWKFGFVVYCLKKRMKSLPLVTLWERMAVMKSLVGNSTMSPKPQVFVKVVIKKAQLHGRPHRPPVSPLRLLKYGECPTLPFPFLVDTTLLRVYLPPITKSKFLSGTTEAV